MAEGKVWREVTPHLAQATSVDADSGMIVAQVLTDQYADDPSQVRSSATLFTRHSYNGMVRSFPTHTNPA